jgi:hypothetical protein
MVAKGDDDKPTQVPELVLESKEDVKRFIEAMRMKEIRSAMGEQMDDAHSHFEVENAHEILKDQRCKIVFKLP